ncbi:hypothetical protein [Tunicatimonas pelagia]|uniref:hypothetical protein n=1 Tax=Tunicatimonas pelagia TaxID=931531 RepID=UPI00266612FD|nr:hypothetical protein [Tunicatimonas pelagia]WKN40488.1 hypothetical protein P0M28_15700 [Tunicatimonas pelagia]
MKNWRIIILLLISVVACSEDEDPQSKPQGKGGLLFNGKEYEVKLLAGDAGCTGNLSLSMSYDDTLNTRVSIVLNNFSAEEGVYTLRRNEVGQNECMLDITVVSHYVYLFGNGGRPSGSYGIVEDKGINELVITCYDSAAQHLEGRFQMTLAIQNQRRIPNINYPDTLQITYGTFVTDVLPLRE